MSFDTFTPRLKNVAERALGHCKKQYGGNGLKIESQIASNIAWRPSFFLKPSSSLILAVEVEDNIYPEILKIAAHDIQHFDFPIAVYQACSLDSFQSDPGQLKINLLRKHGFGIITVADDDTVTIQHPTIPLAQHISPDILDSKLAALNPGLRPKVRAAYGTFITNEGQGLQQAGQLVEGLVTSLAMQASKAGLVSALGNRPLADVIDMLYECDTFRNYRAALGAARNFIKEFRNTASHAPKSPKQAAEKIRRCRAGFLDSIEVIRKVRVIFQALGYKVKLHTT